MNRGQIEKILLDIEENINYYECAKVYERKQVIYLANGKSFTYSVPKNSLAHLLGVNTTYLIATGLFKSKDSYGLLKEICKDEYFFWKKANDGLIDTNMAFSSYVVQKNSCFKENIKINSYKTEFVSEYNKEKSYQLYDEKENYDYIIGSLTDDESYMILGLARNNYNLVPMSNQIFESYESAKSKIERYIKNQSITFISNIVLRDDDSYTKKIITFNDIKKQKMLLLSKYVKEFNCTIDVSGDYLYMLKKFISIRENNMENDQYVNSIIKSILNKEFITEESLGIGSFSELDNFLTNIINAFNDSICNELNVSNNETYSSQHKLLKDLKEKVLMLQQENTNLSEENINLYEQVSILQDQNDQLNCDNKSIQESAEKILKITKRKNI